MTKKIFKLWNEVRTLRREVKDLHKSLDKAKSINSCVLSSLHEKTRVTRELRERLKKQSITVENLEYQLREADKCADYYKERWLEVDREANIFMFAVPQSNVFMRPYRMDSFFDPHADAYYADRKVAEMTDRMKIHLFDELLQRGFIKKYEPTPEETRYELRALKWSK